MAAKKLQPKLVQVHVHVGSDTDIQKLIRELQTYVSRSKMQDRIEVKLDKVVDPDPGDAPGSDLL